MDDWTWKRQTRTRSGLGWGHDKEGANNKHKRILNYKYKSTIVKLILRTKRSKI